LVAQLRGWVKNMPADFHPVAGERVPCDALNVPRSKDFAQLIEDGASPFVSIVECVRMAEGREAVVIDVKATIPQASAVPLLRTERLKVEFSVEDDRYPDVRALRVDFPRECVLHLNLVTVDEPASLCLFSLPWRDIQLRLTANELLSRVQTWLNDTAAGNLHREDQPLEPLYLMGPPLTPLILSPKLAAKLIEGTTPIQLDIAQFGTTTAFIQHRSGRRINGQALPALVVPVISKPHEHCILYNQPRHFEELHGQLEALGIDLLGDVQKELIKREPGGGLSKLGFLVLLIVLLRKRHADSEPEPEIVSFFCIGPNAQEAGLTGLARSLGLTGTGDAAKRGQDVPVMQASVRHELTPEAASNYSGTTEVSLPLVAIGAGALGSQVILQSVRSAMARWTVLDSDILLPHNLVRHALGGEWLGHPKALGVAFEANNMLDEPIVEPIVADFQTPGDQLEAISKAIAEASAIIDLSASVSVARDLAFDDRTTVKRCSVFVSPSGRDLVLLGEDSERALHLDHLEVQYYRSVAEDERLAKHLEGGSSIGSCRNITSRISQELMGLHSSQAVRKVRKWLQDPDPVATVICTEEASATCLEVRVPLGGTVEVGQLGEWSVITDTDFLGRVRAQRAGHLPDETGGVLLGHVDVQRRIVYVAHQIPAPPDSERQPTMYIRGAEGLAAAYEVIQRRTLNNLVYIGEWHSHPDGCDCSPSQDDLIAGAWLAEKTREGSLPGIMLIAGEGDQTCWMLCSRSTADAPIHLFLTAGNRA